MSGTSGMGRLVKPSGSGPQPQDAAAFCGRCGRPAGEPVHESCAALLELEPPRYCTRCARRMVVQVLPTGWTARCSRHGQTAHH